MIKVFIFYDFQFFLIIDTCLDKLNIRWREKYKWQENKQCYFEEKNQNSFHNKK